MQQVLFWSKYSSSCKHLLEEMKKYGVMIETVCVDNPNIRNRIATNPKLQITVVPTLLSIYREGVVEKYEGEKVFQLLQEAFSGAKLVQPKIIKEYVKDVSVPQEIPQEITENLSNSETEFTTLDNLSGDELFEVEENKQVKNSDNTPNHKRTDKKSPIKPHSKLASQAAAIAAAREVHDSNQPRPKTNIISPIQ
jgi:hypothetical protein